MTIVYLVASNGIGPQAAFRTRSAAEKYQAKQATAGLYAEIYEVPLYEGDAP
jgi:hypothetical protein